MGDRKLEVTGQKRGMELGNGASKTRNWMSKVRKLENGDQDGEVRNQAN